MNCGPRNEENFARFWQSTIRPGVPDDVTAKWRKHEFSAVQRGKAVVERLGQFTRLNGQFALDLGCGYGGISITLAQNGATVVGLDYELQRLRGAHIRAADDHRVSGIYLVQSAGEDLPFTDEAFDIVVCNDVLEHVRSSNRTLQEIGRTLKAGGWLYLTFPNRFSPANLWSDPHYGLFGVSLLAPCWGKRYVVSWRRKAADYQVGVLPVASQVWRTLHRLSFSVAAWWPAPRRRIGIFTSLLHWYRLNTQPLITLVSQKSTQLTCGAPEGKT